MIGKITGIAEIDGDGIIIDAGGVGYLIYCSSRTIANVKDGSHITLYIDTQVREDAINLYGFETKSERDSFRTLITVKGLGPKIGLAILGTMNPNQISNALSAKDKLAFTQVSGIGPKLAERIILELKDKFSFISSDDFIKTISINSEAPKINNIIEDAISALSNLGYSRSESYQIVGKLLAENPNMGLSELIKVSLKQLSKV